jgi:hypothetical protein
MMSGCFFELLMDNTETLFAAMANSFASTDKLVSELPAEWQEQIRTHDKSNRQQVLLIVPFFCLVRASIGEMPAGKKWLGE